MLAALFARVVPVRPGETVPMLLATAYGFSILFAYYLVTGFGVLTFLGPYAGPIVGAVLAGPIVFAMTFDKEDA